MHQHETNKTKPARTQHSSRRVFAQTMAALAAAMAVLLATAGPAAAESGAWKGDFDNNNTALKRTVTCIVVTYQNTGKTGSKLTDCDGASRDSRWDNNLFKFNTDLVGKSTTSKGSNGCPDKAGGEYVKCIFINSANIVVTVSQEDRCCPRLLNKTAYARWSGIS